MRLWYVFFFFILLYNCQNTKTSSNKLYSVLPNKAFVVLESQNYSNIESSLDEIEMVTPIDDSLRNKIKALSNTIDFNGHIAIGLFNTSNDHINFALVHEKINLSGSQDSTEMAVDIATETSEVTPLKINNNTFFKRTTNGFELFSDSEQLLMRKELFSDDALLENIQKTQSIYNGVNIYNINATNVLPIFSNQLKESYPSASYLQSKKETGLFQLSGISKFSDSLSVMKRFTGTTAQQIELSKVIPADIRYFKSISFDSIARYLSNRVVDSSITANDSLPNYIMSTREVGIFETTEFSAVGIRITDPSIFESIYEINIPTESYKDFQIYEHNNQELFKELFSPFISFDNATVFCLIESSILFAKNPDHLKQIITSYLNKNTLSENGSYKSFDSFLLKESSLFTYWNKDYILSNYPKLSKEYNSSGFQLTIENDYFHINGVLTKYDKENSKSALRERFSIDFDNDIIVGPQLVKNHLNGTKDILVQDIQNNLILLSNKGKIFWKKQLDGKILGEVKQIDMYKNGRLQLAFSTSNKVYVLDRNGNEVNPFPLNFKDKITQPLSVFDYDSNKSYRLLVTQGSQLLMYDAKGKRVKGFNYKSDKKEITSQPKHIRISRKDYIVFKSLDRLKILNRQGSSRISVNTDINFSDNDIYPYQNQFSTTTAEGALVQVDTKGRLTQQNLNLPKDHFLESTNKTLVTQTENKLSVKLKKIELDYGNYTRPKIFYLRDKIYVTTTDRQSKQAFLFDSQGKSISGFPIFGVSQLVLDNLDSDNNLEVVVQPTSKSLSVFDMR